MRVKKKIKKIISIFLVCVMVVSNIQFLYAENTDSETTKIESIDVEKNENEDLATLSQIELEEEKKELKEEPEEEKEREASSSEIDEIEKEEKEEEATRSEIEKEQEEEKQEEKEEQEEQEEQEEKATSSQIEEEKTPLKKEEDIIIIEATASNISEIKIEEQVVFAAPQEYILSPSWYDETAAGKAKGEITKIKISKSPETAPTDSDTSWNIAGSNGLIAYIKGTDLTIYAPNEGTIFMAEDSSYLFSGNNTGMFNKLAAIQNLNLLDTSKVKNMSSMFEAAQNLTSIDLSNFNTSNVEDMSKMFFFCRGLYQLDVSGFDTKEVKSFNDMFFSCQRVSAIDVTKFNTDNCENMAGMFYGCDSLSKVDVSKFNTSKVTDMSSMFNSCYSLTTIDLSNFDTSNVTDLSHMFNMFNKNMSNLKKLDLSSFDTKNVTSMAQIFYNCNALETILASSKFVTTGLTQEKSDLFMFSGCQSIKGGNGTPYNDNKVDKTYAKIDESGSPGYFTAKEVPPVPVEGKVTFTFDLQGHGNNYNVTINVGEIGLSYEIVDSTGAPYLDFNITNTLDYYKVIEAFGDYSVGDRIEISEYLSLQESEKPKCTSALITLTFDPTLFRLDMTNEAFLQAVRTTNTTLSDGYDYINSVTFRTDAISSTSVRFYKLNTNNNYTYPFVNNTPIITFSSE